MTGDERAEAAYYEWARREAWRWASREAKSLLPKLVESEGSGPVLLEGESRLGHNLEDLLHEVWMRPAFVRARGEWSLGPDGAPRVGDSSAAPRAYLRTSLRRAWIDLYRRGGEGFEERPVRPAPEEDAQRALERLVHQAQRRDGEAPADPLRERLDPCTRRCMEERIRVNGLHFWAWYLAKVQALRDPTEIAAQLGLSPGSVSKTVKRVQLLLRACVEACRDAGGEP